MAKTLTPQSKIRVFVMLTLKLVAEGSICFQ